VEIALWIAIIGCGFVENTKHKFYRLFLKSHIKCTCTMIWLLFF